MGVPPKTPGVPSAEPASAPLSRVRRLAKRDGREVPFDGARIADAVRRAMTAVGEEDPTFAQDVADVVSLAVGARFGRREGGAAPGSGAQSPLPTVEDVQDLVEQALIEMGRARVARAYILYRDKRARARDALKVTERPDRAGYMPWVRAGAGTSPWSQARIVAALMEEADLPRETSEEVAERVEGRVFDSGLARISTSLIREFVDNELMAMGLRSALHRQEPVGIPRHDLRRMFARPRPGGGADSNTLWAPRSAGLEEDVAAAIMRRYTLADVLDERTAELHKNGALWVEGLDRPHMALARSIPAGLCLRREPSPDSGAELLEELALLLRGVSHGLVVEGLHAAVAPLVRSTRPGARHRDRLRDLLGAMGALACATGRSLDLAAPGGRGGTLVRRLLGELDALRRAERSRPHLFLSWEELAPALEAEPTLSQAAENLLACGTLVPVWHGSDLRWAAPGCRRRRREGGALGCGGAVAINLPRLARQAGPWREDLLFGALATRVQNALDAIEALDAFQRGHPAARGEGLRERRGFALTPVGLVEALRILGDGAVRPTQGARLLGVMGDAARRFAEERGLSVCLSPFFGDQASRSMAHLDAAAPRASQARLFADLPALEEGDDRPYTVGYASSGDFALGIGALGIGAAEIGERDPAHDAGELAVLCSTLRAGSLAPASLQATGGEGLVSALTAWHHFHERRASSHRAQSPSPTPPVAAPEGPDGTLFQPARG